MSRHERRKAKVSELKMISVADLVSASKLCAWDGCAATFKGDMPKGWTWIVQYWSKHPQVQFLDIPPKDMEWDVCLCPEHTRALKDQLKDVGVKLGPMPALGQA